MGRAKFYPSRAILAERQGQRDTATWQLIDLEWRCCSASRNLKWMVGLGNFDHAKENLQKQGFKWNWIPSNLAHAPKPPF